MSWAPPCRAYLPRARACRVPCVPPSAQVSDLRRAVGVQCPHGLHSAPLHVARRVSPAAARRKSAAPRPHGARARDSDGGTVPVRPYVGPRRGGEQVPGSLHWQGDVCAPGF